MPRADSLSPGAIKLLREPHIANFVTLMPDGSPHITPVWVDVEPDGSHVLVNTVVGHVKQRNLSRDPRVALLVLDAMNVHRWVMVRGTVMDQDLEHAEAHINLLAKKYTGLARYTYRRGPEQRVIVRIKPHHVTETGV